jgi:hypothetical protein
MREDRSGRLGDRDLAELHGSRVVTPPRAP